MYNKLFVKILDSSIWLEPTPTRIVWITLLAAMDQDGYAHFSATENLASRARVTIEECVSAIKTLQSPDKDSGDPEFDGRRIEKVPGGFMILNAPKYRDILNKTVERERTRLRVAKHRAKQDVTKTVTGLLQPVTGNVTVTPVTPSVSEAEAEAYSEAEELRKSTPSADRFKKPSIEEIKLLAVKAGMNESEAYKFWNFYESKGWMVGKNKMRSVAGALAGWKIRAEEKQAYKSNGADKIVIEKEYERILARMKEIPKMYDEHREWSLEHRSEFGKLKARRDELKSKLGVTL